MAGCRLWEKFLRHFGFFSPASTPNERIGERAPISDSERLSRYVTNEGHFNVSKDQVHFRAFLPSPKDDELSIMRTDSLGEPQVWTLGVTAVGEPSGRTILARADFFAPDVRGSFIEAWRLTVIPDEPPLRHALIKGWPPREQTEIRKSLAQQLRAKARLQVRPA